jgi:hypothetical protein
MNFTNRWGMKPSKPSESFQGLFPYRFLHDYGIEDARACYAVGQL